MDRLRNESIILTLLDKMREQGSWCGETHIQKATYFLKEMTNVPVDFDFILYKHGPFSFDLRDELAAMQADELLSFRSQYPYGSTLTMTDQGRALTTRFPKTLNKYGSEISFVAKKLGDKGVSALEKLATALYVIKEDPSDFSIEDLSARIHELKPHVSLHDSETAVIEVQKMIEEYASA